MKTIHQAAVKYIALCLLLSFAPVSNAYLDPGTGSYILQMLAAGILGGLYAIKMYWIRIKLFFWNLFAKKDENDES